MKKVYLMGFSIGDKDWNVRFWYLNLEFSSGSPSVVKSCAKFEQR